MCGADHASNTDVKGRNVETYEEIKALELEFMKPETRQDVVRLNEMISENFEEFGGSGRVYRKQDMLNLLPQQELASNYVLSDFTFKQLCNNCILVKYRSSISGKNALRSSIWVNSNGCWQILHHQATVVDDAV